MIRYHYLLLSVLIIGSPGVKAAPNGAVLILNGKHLGHCRVTTTAVHKYFGELEGPAWENRYTAWRYYANTGNRNSIDIVGKYTYEGILQYADQAGFELHADHPWGGDIYKCGSTLGLGGFNLYDNNGTWINPGIGKNLDSMTITIVDSSVQTPRVVVEYWGLLVNGSKNRVTWTISTRQDIRPTNCELTITGSYNGKIVVGMRRYEASNVRLIQDSEKALLATLGNQAGMVETYTDTLLQAIITDKKYFGGFTSNSLNYGMVLTPDAGKKVAWSMAYNWAREPEQVFRNQNWQAVLFTGMTALSRTPLPSSGTAKTRGLEIIRTPNGLVINCPQPAGTLRIVDCLGKIRYTQKVANGSGALTGRPLSGSGILFAVWEDPRGYKTARAIPGF